MPLPGMRWRHIVVNTHSTWLHGDPRGFRSREHRIHSSGDYKSPPPSGEHEGLHRYQKQRSDDPTKIRREAYRVVGAAIVQNLRKNGNRFVIVSVNATHAHLLAEFPDDVDRIKGAVGWIKWFATRALREAFAEYARIEIWADGETYKPVDDPAHFLSTENYIRDQQGEDTWVYSARSSTSTPAHPGPQDPA